MSGVTADTTISDRVSLYANDDGSYSVFVDGHLSVDFAKSGLRRFTVAVDTPDGREVFHEGLNRDVASHVISLALRQQSVPARVRSIIVGRL